jgi:hypothetical protein
MNKQLQTENYASSYIKKGWVLTVHLNILFVRQEKLVANLKKIVWLNVLFVR